MVVVKGARKARATALATYADAIVTGGVRPYVEPIVATNIPVWRHARRAAVRRADASSAVAAPRVEGLSAK